MKKSSDQMIADAAAPTFRPNTIDYAIWRSVATLNEYMICDRFGSEDAVVDVGMHIGSFCYLALQRGAGIVWGFEADYENYTLARDNLRGFGQRAHLVNAAVCRSDEPPEKLHFDGYTDFHPRRPDVKNTGAGTVLSNRGREVPAMAFDRILDDVTKNGRDRVRLLKIDCEGSEFPILLTSRRLNLIDEIVGEYHHFDQNCIPEQAQIPGYSVLECRSLVKCLRTWDFVVRTNGSAETGGHFTAWNRQWLAQAASRGKESENRTLPIGD
jgi:FkbM family methyltransferase